MRTFLRVMDRILVHLYCLAGLGIALVFLVNESAYYNATFAMLKAQAQALYIIASELHGYKT